LQKISAALLIAAGAACQTGSQGGRAGGAVADAGAADGPAAVDQFLGAVKRDDVQDMARVFGTAAGPIAARDAADAVQKRMRALQCYLRHDSARTIGASTGAGAGQVLRVELRQRELVRETRFTTVPGPGGRWFVESFDINALSDLCRP
jgi:hypothetical protein